MDKAAPSCTQHFRTIELETWNTWALMPFVAETGILAPHSQSTLLIRTVNCVGTKIMATLGPSVHDVDTLSQMLEAGMVAGRVDLTWGPIEFHKNSLRYLEVGADAVGDWGMNGRNERCRALGKCSGLSD